MKILGHWSFHLLSQLVYGQCQSEKFQIIVYQTCHAICGFLFLFKILANLFDSMMWSPCLRKQNFFCQNCILAMILYLRQNLVQYWFWFMRRIHIIVGFVCRNLIDTCKSGLRIKNCVCRNFVVSLVIKPTFTKFFTHTKVPTQSIYLFIFLNFCSDKNGRKGRRKLEALFQRFSRTELFFYSNSC